jgi:DICT domain-containing protein/signal transduction histidine kinase
MSNSSSIVETLLQSIPHLRAQLYFKSSLTALSHAMEDQVLAGSDHPLVIASFQRERFYRQEARRYLRIASYTSQVYVLAAPETEFSNRSGDYEMVAFEPTDALAQEWHLVVLGQQYATCLVCRERDAATTRSGQGIPTDVFRRFEGIWTFDRHIVCKTATLLLDRIVGYRPELASKVAEAQAQLQQVPSEQVYAMDPAPFTDRLTTHLQAGQYKLLKAYRSIAAQERKERLVNSITNAIRRSLNPDEILTIATQELGQALNACRCLIYRYQADSWDVAIQHEYHKSGITSLNQQRWPLQDNPLFKDVETTLEPICIEDTRIEPRIKSDKALKSLVKRWRINAWLIVPVRYQGRLLGLIELHHCQALPYAWSGDEQSLVDAIATQIGIALIQAQAYANLEDFNQQLEALDRTRSNLIAITGHELRTPLSTIQVCLESLASEPDMALDIRQVMLNTALEDSRRMQGLVQDFLTLSHLESGQVQWHLDAIPLQECVDLAMSSIRAKQRGITLPNVTSHVSDTLPLVRVDGEWLVEVLGKLLDNACKFTAPDGSVTIQAYPNGAQMLEVTVADTGRGIEPDRLEAIFERFYQEEGALRRSAGGTGLGLAICRQIVQGLGGKIWAESAGKDQGSQFHFTLPMIDHCSPAQPSLNPQVSSST